MTAGSNDDRCVLIFDLPALKNVPAPMMHENKLGCGKINSSGLLAERYRWLAACSAGVPRSPAAADERVPEVAANLYRDKHWISSFRV
jgi:hypothetical protein